METPVAPLAGLLSVGAASRVTAGCVAKLFLFDHVPYCVLPRAWTSQ